MNIIIKTTPQGLQVEIPEEEIRSLLQNVLQKMLSRKQVVTFKEPEEQTVLTVKEDLSNKMV